jgi:hypothetical protein
LTELYVWNKKKEKKILNDVLFAISQSEPNSIKKEIADILAETRE